MAKQTLAYDITLTGDDAIAELDAIGKKAKESKTWVEKLGEAGKSAMSGMRAEAEKAEKALDGVGSVQRAESVLKVSEGIVGGFTAAQGAMALFGSESEELQKTMLKVQSALAISQGIKMVTEGISHMGTAFDTLKAKLLKNPILTFAIAIAAITLALAAWLTSESALEAQIRKSREAEEKRFEASQKGYDRAIELARAEGREVSALERGKTIDKLNNVKLRIKLIEKENEANSEYEKYRKAFFNEESSDQKKRVEEKQKLNNEILDIENSLFADTAKNVRDLLSVVVKANDDTFEAEKARIDKSKAYREKAFADEKKRQQEINDQLKESEDKLEKDRDERNQKGIAEAERQLKVLPEIANQVQQKVLEDQISAWEEFEAMTANFADFLNGKYGQAATGIMNTIMQGSEVVGAFLKSQEEDQLKAAEGNAAKTEQIRKKYFEKNKRLQIAQATMSMFQSALEAYKATVGIPIAGPVLAPIAAGAALAAGLLNINNIRKQTYDGGGGTGGGGGGAPSFPSGGLTAPPVNGDDGQVFKPGTPNNPQPQAQPMVIENIIVASELTKKQAESTRSQNSATFR